jgi:GNAT superfamily N-acetyltransferase
VWWAVWSGGEAVGFAGAKPDGKDAQLTRAGLLPSARGAGLQRRLIQARLKWARERGARNALTYTSALNVASMRQLVREGFVPYASEPDEQGTWISFGKSLVR